MKSAIVPTLVKIACVASLLSAVACTAATSEEPRTKTKTSASATSTASDIEEEGDADKVTCAVDADCDSDERCQSGRCAGLDGDQE